MIDLTKVRNGLWSEPSLILGATTMVQASTALASTCLAVLGPFLREEFGLSRVELGGLASARHIGAAGGSVPVSWLVDRFGARLILLLAPMVTGLAIAGFAVAAGLWHLAFILLMVTGMGYAATNVAGAKSILFLFPQERRGLAMGLRLMGNGISDVLSAVALPAIALVVGWRWGAGAAGAVAVGTGLVAWFVLGRFDGDEHDKPRSQKRPLAVLRMRSVWACSLISFTLQGAHFSGSTFLVLYGREALGYGLVAAGGLLSVAGLAGLCGRIGWGLVSDRFFGGRRVPAAELVTIVGCVACLGLALAGAGTPHWLALLLAGMFGVSMMGNLGLRQNLVSEAVDPAAAGLALGVTQTAAGLGAMVCPPSFGWLADVTGSYVAAWGCLSMVLLVLAVLMRFLHLEHRPRRTDSNVRREVLDGR